MTKPNKHIYRIRTPNLDYSIPVDTIVDIGDYQNGGFTVLTRREEILIIDPMYAGLIRSAHYELTAKWANLMRGRATTPAKTKGPFTYYPEESWRAAFGIPPRKKPKTFLIRTIKK